MNAKKKFQYTLSTASLCLTILANAQTSNTWGLSSMEGRALLSGTATNARIGVFSGDLLQPILNNDDGFLFVDLMGDYGTDDTYLMSPGAVYRQVFNNKIFGFYAFDDYERTSLGENFWVVSPGIEFITPQWDAHVNGYFPTSTAEQIGPSVFADTLGDYSHVGFVTGTHTQTDELVTPNDIIGNGVDAEIGYSFSAKDHLRSRAYVGMYYYQPPSGYRSYPSTGTVENITGVTAGFNQALTKNISLSIFNSYDQVSNYTIGAGVTVTFGGDSNIFSHNVRDRLLDPVQRHVGIIATGAGTYDQEGWTANAVTETEADDIYFISENGTGDGTYGNPAPLTQTTLDMINAESLGESKIYIQGGTNANYYVNSTTATETNLDGNGDLGLYLYSGQDLYGRSADYTAPAPSDEQPNITITEESYSGFVVQEGENTFSDLTFNQSINGIFVSGVVVYSSSSDNETVNIVNSNFDGLGLRALWVTNQNNNNAVTINLTNSTLTNNIYGIEANNSSDSGSLTINATNSSFSNNTSDGIYADNYTQNGTLTINLTDSELNNNANGGIEAYNGNPDSTPGAGSAVFTINIVNSQLNNSGSNGLFASQAEDNGSFFLNATSSQFNNNAGSGISLANAGTNGAFDANITSSQISEMPTAYAFVAVNNSGNDMTVSITNSEFNNDLVGMYLANTASGTLSVNDLSGATFSNDSTGIDAVNSGIGTINVNWTDAIFEGNSADRGQSNTGGGQINWTPYF